MGFPASLILRKEKSPISDFLFSSMRLAWSESPIPRCKCPTGRARPPEDPPQLKGGKIPSARPGRVTLTPGRAKTLQPRSRWEKRARRAKGIRNTSPSSQRPPLRSFSGRGPDLPSFLPPRGKKAGRPADRQGAPMAAAEGGASAGWLGPPEAKPRCWGSAIGEAGRGFSAGLASLGIARAREPRRIARGCFSREDRHPSRLRVSHGGFSLATATALWDVNRGTFPRSRHLGRCPSP